MRRSVAVFGGVLPLGNREWRAWPLSSQGAEECMIPGVRLAGEEGTGRSCLMSGSGAIGEIGGSCAARRPPGLESCSP
jgi:hypothetical protein